MEWGTVHDRLCTELIRARDTIVSRWGVALRAHGLVPWSLEGCASDLVIQAAAALADGMPAETPWERCSGLLRLSPGAPLETELTLLWRAIGTAAAHLSLSVDQHHRASEALSAQLAATLRAANAAVLEAASGTPATSRFGGVVVFVATGGPHADDARQLAAG